MKEPVICDIVCPSCSGTDWSRGKDVHSLICKTENCGYIIDSEGMGKLLDEAYAMGIEDRAREIFVQLKEDGMNIVMLDCGYEGDNKIWVAFAMDQDEKTLEALKEVLNKEDLINPPAMDLIESIHELYHTLKATYLVKDSVFKEGYIINHSNAEGVAKLTELFTGIPVIAVIKPGEKDYVLLGWPQEYEAAGNQAMFAYLVHAGELLESQREDYLADPEKYDEGSLLQVRAEDFKVECENIHKRGKGDECA